MYTPALRHCRATSTISRQESPRSTAADSAFSPRCPLPDVDAALAEAARAIDTLGAIGVVLMSNSGGQYLGDAALNPLWELLDGRRAAAFVHPTSPPHAESTALGRPRPMIEFMFETTRTVTDMICAAVTARYAGIRFLIPHCGAALLVLAERIELFRSVLPGPNGQPPFPSTTHDQLQRFWYDLAGYPLPTHAHVLAQVIGSDRILYGSDSCWTPVFGVERQIAALDADGVTEWRAITRPPTRSGSWQAPDGRGARTALSLSGAPGRSRGADPSRAARPAPGRGHRRPR